MSLSFELVAVTADGRLEGVTAIRAGLLAPQLVSHTHTRWSPLQLAALLLADPALVAPILQRFGHTAPNGLAGGLLAGRWTGARLGLLCDVMPDDELPSELSSALDTPAGRAITSELPSPRQEARDAVGSDDDPEELDVVAEFYALDWRRRALEYAGWRQLDEHGGDLAPALVAAVADTEVADDGQPTALVSLDDGVWIDIETVTGHGSVAANVAHTGDRSLAWLLAGLTVVSPPGSCPDGWPVDLQGHFAGSRLAIVNRQATDLDPGQRLDFNTE